MPPDLLVVSIDTLRADHLSLYGYARATTPNIDTLARQAHVFLRAYTPMPTTLPAHVAMFSGRAPRETGVLRNGVRIPPELPLLAERLSEKGWATAGFVSAAVLRKKTGIDRGFSVYDEPEGSERDCEATLDRASGWLAGRGADPFFAFVHFFDPHTLYAPPRRQAERFGAPAAAMPPHLQFLPDDVTIEPEGVDGSIRAYDAEIAHADDCFGRLLDRVEQLERPRPRVVVVVSDHGESLDELLVRERYAFDHGEFLSHEQLHVPLVLYDGQSPGPRRHARVVSTQALASTLLELVLGEAPPGVAPSLFAAPGEQRESRVLSQRRTFDRPPRSDLSGEAWSLVTDRGQLLRDAEGDRWIPLDPDGRVASRPVPERAPDDVSAILDGLLGAGAPGGAAPTVNDPDLATELRALGYTE